MKAVEDLDKLENLTVLHLRDNQINTLDGFSENMKKLQYLNLRFVNLLYSIFRLADPVALKEKCGKRLERP